MTNSIQHPAVHNLIKQITNRVPTTSSGTYNRADPTAWSKGSDTFFFRDQEYEIAFADCTWGREWKIFGKRGRKEFLLTWFYTSWDSGELDTFIRRDTYFKHTFLLLKHYIAQTEEVEYSYEDEDTYYFDEIHGY